MKTFEELGLSKSFLQTIEKLGFKTPSEIQEKAIPIALAGRDIIGGSATGSGKTLAFATPIIENLKPNNHVQALVLTPTRELAEQVADEIKKFSEKKLNILSVYGGVEIDRQIRKLAVTDVLVGTPGRILDHLQRRTLRLDQVKFLVIDEVDRMFDMGFQEDVERIISFCPKKRQTMLFSATISSDVDYLSHKHTNKPEEISVESHVDPTKLKQVFYDVQDRMKFSLLVQLLKHENSDLVMVFCSTRRNVDFVTKNLINQGIKAKAIHGGLAQNKRSKVLEEFHGKGVSVLVATDVAARGLDIKSVTHVYNYDLPKTCDDYIHRIGRTARAGEKGKAVNLLCSRDYENFSAIQEDKCLNIKSEKTPFIKMVDIEFDDNRRPRGNFNRGPPRRNSNRRPPRGRNQNSRGPARNNQGPRKDFGKKPFKKKSFGNKRYVLF